VVVPGVGAGSHAVQQQVQQAAASARSADALRSLGAEPVEYGDGLVDRVRELAPEDITAAMDLHGTDTVSAARELGVPDERITAIAARVEGITSANGANAAPGVVEEIAGLVAEGRIRVPIPATFPVEQIRAAVELQAGRHVHGKVVVEL
jgi:NADPH:quinone reductase-like Zn-dependent oxidoreductase